MVEVSSEPSTSAPKRKNRRSLHKNKSATIPKPTAQKTNVEVVDQEMEPVDQEVYGPVTSSSADTEVERDQPGDVGNDDEVMIDTDPSVAGLPPSSAPSFPALTGSALQTALKSEMRRIPIPPHRMSPLKKDWINIFGPLTEILGLQVRMNIPRKSVEIRVSSFLSVFRSLFHGYRFIISAVRHQNTRKRSGHSRKVQTLLKPTHLGLTSTYVPSPRPYLLIAVYLLKYIGRNCPSAAGRSLPRLLRDQGRKNPARRPPGPCHRYPNSFFSQLRRMSHKIYRSYRWPGREN